MTDHTGAPEVAGRVPRLTDAEAGVLPALRGHSASSHEVSLILAIDPHKASLIHGILQVAQQRDLVEVSDGRWQLTATGRAALAAMEKQDG